MGFICIKRNKPTKTTIVKNANGLHGNTVDIMFLIAYVSTLTATTTYNVKSNVCLRMHDGKGQDGKYPKGNFPLFLTY